MKLLRVGAPGAEKPAMMAPDGTIRDLSAIVPDFTAEVLAPEGLAKLAALDPATLPEAAPGRIGPCIPRPLNFLCIGLNYADHAAESGMPIPKEPIMFMKSLGAFQGPYDDIRMPRASKKLDWEVELTVVIGTKASYVPEHEAMDHVAGYCVVNDVSEREYQIERGGTWDKGKGCDTFGPTGPWLVTKDEVGDVHDLRMWVDVDGVRMQDGTTKTMIFNVPKLVSYCSHFMTLYPGDIIATGTPPGVGLGKKPEPVFLKVGQVVKTGIEKLGEQVATVVG